MPTILNSRDELLALFPDNNSQLIEAKDIRAFVNAIYDEAVIIGEDVINDLNSAEIEYPLSANQGKILENTKENFLGLPGNSGYILSSDLNGHRTWIPQKRKLSDLNDVYINNPRNGDVLTYNDTVNKWIPSGISVSSFSEKGGIYWKSYVEYKKGTFISYDINNTQGIFVSLTDILPNRPPDIYPGGWQEIYNVKSLNDLQDVNIISTNPDYFLLTDINGVYKPRDFEGEVTNIFYDKINEGIGIDISYDNITKNLKISLNAYLNDLNDVSSNNPNTGDILIYDGNNWVPSGVIQTIDRGGNEWSPDFLYPKGAIVTYNNIIFQSLFGNINQPPPSNSWKSVSLENLPDVDAPDPSTGDMLIFDTISSKYVRIKTTYLGESENRFKIPKLNQNGKLDNSMIEATMFHRIDSWDPTVQEYPDTHGHTPGAFWDIIFNDGVTLEYTYTTGDLIGKTVKAGDFIIWGIGGWTVMPAVMNPMDYYRRDGSQPLTANLEVDNYKIVNLANGTDLTDGVNVQQLQTKEDNLGNPSKNDYILSSDVNGNRRWVENTGGLQEVNWGDIEGDIINQTDLQTQFYTKADKVNVFNKTEYLDSSNGNAGLPIITTSNGKIDNSFLDLTVLEYVGTWTPTSSNEYPSATEGQMFVVDDLVVAYTFNSGDLAGQTATNGDFMIFGSNGWSLIDSGIDPDIYYPLDGSKSLTGPFAGGNQQIKNIAQGTDNADAITLFQHNLHKYNFTNPHNVNKNQVGLSNVENLRPEDMPISYETQNALDQKEDWLNVPPTNNMILSSDTSGNRNWIPLPDPAEWGKITGNIDTQTDLQDQFDTKVNKSGDSMSGELHIDNNLFSKSLTLDVDSNINSKIRFKNTSGGDNFAELWWSNQERKYKISDYQLTYDLLHTGVFDPDSKVNIDGDAMRGPLILNQDPITSMEASTKKYVDDRFNNLPTNVMTTDIYDTDNSGIVDDSEKLGGNLPSYYASQLNLDQKVSKSGDTMTGDLIINSDIAAYSGTLNFLKINLNNNISRIEFSDVNQPGAKPSIFWNSNTGNFTIDEKSSGGYVIWHSGNLRPETINRTIRKTFIGDGVTTTFGIPEGYTPWNANVYYNGVRIFEPDDVDISSGTEIVFTIAPEQDDRIDFEGFKNGLLGDHPS